MKKIIFLLVLIIVFVFIFCKENVVDKVSEENVVVVVERDVEFGKYLVMIFVESLFDFGIID